MWSEEQKTHQREAIAFMRESQQERTEPFQRIDEDGNVFYTSTGCFLRIWERYHPGYTVVWWSGNILFGKERVGWNAALGGFYGEGWAHLVVEGQDTLLWELNGLFSLEQIADLLEKRFDDEKAYLT